MNTIQLDQLKPGQEFRITTSNFTPIKTAVTYHVADVEGHLIYKSKDTPLLYDNRRNLARMLQHAGLVMRHE